MSRSTVLPWVVTREIEGEERPLASFALRNDAEYYLKNPKYKGQLKVIFNGRNSGVVIDCPVYHAKIASPGEFYGFLVAEEFELNSETQRYEGVVHNLARGKTSINKSYLELPDTIFNLRVVWIAGHP